MTNSDHAVEAQGLVKHFKTTKAVDGVDLVVPTGSVLGLLGPNGAGKTTTVRMMTTLSIPTSGTARVAGFDVVADPDAVRHRMGLTAQSATVDELLTGRENLRLMADLAHLDRATASTTVSVMLESFDLVDAADRRAQTYSGGMKRRLDLAMTLIARPRLIFLDEPTAGLDPRSRRDLWAIVRQQVADGGRSAVTPVIALEGAADQLTFAAVPGDAVDAGDELFTWS